jgi:hypothetical protein
MLRREAEQLQRQMEQLAQNGQGQQGGQQQNGQQGSSGQSSGQSGSQSGSQQGSSSQGGSQASQQQAGNKSAQTPGQSQGQSQDQRVEQALSRLRQANDAMKRSAGPQQNTDAARKAAEKLRDATNLLGGTQQQLASGKLDSLSHEADRLTQEERAQADRIDKLANQQQGDADTMNRDSMMARLQERDRLAAERQQLSGDLSKLQKGVRDAAREMAPNQPGVAQKLRDALTEMDQSDLDNHVQRTADWLRGGINPNSNGTEKEIAEGLQKLSQQLRQAQQGMMGQSKPGQGGAAQGDETAALGQVERLRSQLEAMASSRRGNGQQQGQNSQNDQQGRSGQGGQQGRNAQQSQNGQPGQSGSQQGQAYRGGQQPASGQQSTNGGQPGRGGQQPGQNAQGGAQQGGRQGGAQPGSGFGQQGNDSGGQRNGQSGDVRYGGGGGADGTVWGNINTGNNRYGRAGQRPAPLDASGNPADTERTYQQSMRELNQLRQMVQGDPQATKDVQELTRQMQQLDPSRFPGNPAMVEQMHQEVLSSVDRIELQLQRAGASTEARTGKSYAVPAGYQDSVAEYYRRLSKNP